MRIGVDLDGVVYDFVEALRHYLVTHRGFDRYDLGESTSWNFFKDNWGMTTPEFLGYFRDGVEAGVIFQHGEAEPYAKEVIDDLRDAGHTIHICTFRTIHEACPQITMDWLKRVGIEYDSITFSEDKTVIKTDIFIEDNMENYMHLLGAGTVGIMMDRPWNRALKNARRVENWIDFAREIEIEDTVRRERVDILA
jgi:5'(3')-deoxyribonucleotidase